MPPDETLPAETLPDETPHETPRGLPSGETLRRTWVRLLSWGWAVLLVDQLTKMIVHRALTLQGPPQPVLGEVLRLTYIQNAGSALGLFGGSRWFFVGVSLLSMLVILALVQSGRYRDRHLINAFGLILGGAAGNLVDRLWLGRVIDFIEMGIAGHYWPVYNVADIGITAGVVLLGIRVLLEKPLPPAGTEELRS